MNKIILITSIITMMALSGCVPLNNSTDYIDGKTNQNNAAVNTNAGSAAPNKNKLNLSAKGLTEVSQDIFTMTNLTELNVSNNKLTGSLPGEIRHLKNLQILDASNNQMTGVPAEIGQLTNLRILNLSYNQLTGLPNELGNLKNLETLNLSGNNYSTQDLETIRQNLPSQVNIIL